MREDRRRRQEHRERLRRQYERSRSRRRHEPPEDPPEWEPKPWWRYSLEVLMENPLGLVLVVLAIALLLYWFF